MNTSAHRAPEPVHRTILVPLDGSHLADGALPPTPRGTVRRHAEGAHALGTEHDDPRIHVKVDTDVEAVPAARAHRCATATPPRTQRRRERIRPPSRRTVGAGGAGSGHLRRLRPHLARLLMRRLAAAQPTPASGPDKALGKAA